MQVDVDDWIICGDFNEVRRESEHKNCVFVESRAKMFNDFIDKSNLIDIPLGGLKFTRISDDGLKYSKLDRFFVSEACISRCVDIAACTLDRNHYDYFPIILKVCANDFGPRPTRVFNNWFEDVECEELIKNAWKLATRNPQADCIVRDKLKRTKLVLKEKCNPKYNTLNIENENLQKEVAKWENLLGSRDLTESEILVWLDTRKKWFEKDKQKAEILKQKSRVKWATDGDENSKYFHSCCNSSFITLIPKKNDLQGFGDYRSISLIGCLYKILSEVLTKRLQAVISSVIGFEQSACYESHQKSLYSRCINWDFLFEIMKLMGFGSRWIKWIKACLSSASISILINSSPTKEFKLQRGVRQGDPLSLYLFIMAAEGLNHLTQIAAISN
ncbi:uncharacterized protein [Rutidosis leptorrhynchoides]|uniref:uncharacterized protein n=1 Tax=Rutidosis leptorrhynchoides TaxID=125765 RepID=UPI003A993E5E